MNFSTLVPNLVSSLQ